MPQIFLLARQQVFFKLTYENYKIKKALEPQKSYIYLCQQDTEKLHIMDSDS